MASDVISMIKEDHRDVESLFERLQKMPENRPALLAELAAKFVAHARAEERKIYPLLAKRRPDEKEEVHHGEDEHHEAEEILAQLLAADPDGPEFDTVLQELISAVSHHVEEEETEILPALEKAVPPDERAKLGKVFSRLKAEELQTPPKPRQRSKEELLRAAEEAGVEGRSSMSKEELLTAIKAAKQS
ncbi:hemerythrin domain-containing protein [Microbispora sp. NPDC049125]|uniref:hemerythrin domain-containing protein n=1 Tax=Microbispora sp. NPDC049125 TaxID=3154929 RepID=UPI0034674D70